MLQNIIFDSVNNITKAIYNDLFYDVTYLTELSDLKTAVTPTADTISIQITFDQNLSEPRILSMIGFELPTIIIIADLSAPLQADINAIKVLVEAQIESQLL